MTDQALTLTDSQIDYLRELMNIGGGSAAGTLSFILDCPVDSQVPSVHIGRISEIAALFGHQGTSLTGIRLLLTGDVRGSLIFFVAEADKRRFMDIARRRTAAAMSDSDVAIMSLVSQAVAASNLEAVKRFCGLDIHSSKPVPVANLSPTSSNDHQALLIESTFVIAGDHLKTHMLLIPDRDSLQALVSSVDYVTRMLLGSATTGEGP